MRGFLCVSSASLVESTDVVHCQAAQRWRQFSEMCGEPFQHEEETRSGKRKKRMPKTMCMCVCVDTCYLALQNQRDEQLTESGAPLSRLRGLLHFVCCLFLFALFPNGDCDCTFLNCTECVCVCVCVFSAPVCLGVWFVVFVRRVMWIVSSSARTEGGRWLMIRASDAWGRCAEGLVTTATRTPTAPSPVAVEGRKNRKKNKDVSPNQVCVVLGCV